MTTRRKPTPSYLLHQQSGRARDVWTDPLGIRHQKLLPLMEAADALVDRLGVDGRHPGIAPVATRVPNVTVW